MLWVCVCSCACVCASCVGGHVGVAVVVCRLGSAYGDWRVEAGCDGAVETADEGGGDTFEAAAFVADDRAGRAVGGGGGGEAVVPAEAPDAAKVGAEAALRVGCKRLEVEVKRVAEVAVLVDLVLLGGKCDPVGGSGGVGKAGECEAAPDGGVDGDAACGECWVPDDGVGAFVVDG